MRNISSEQGPVAVNPNLSSMRIALVVSIVWLLGITLLGISQLQTLFRQHWLPFYGWAMLIAEPFFVLWIVRMALRLRTLERIKRLCRSLTAERGIGVASDGSVPAQSAFPTSLSITMRFKRSYIGLFAVLVLVLVGPDTIKLVVQSVQAGSSSLSEMALLLFFMVFVFALLGVGFIPFFIVRLTVDATENGLKTGPGKFISWQEARFFACYRFPGLFPGHRTTVVYELSSSSKVLTWIWIPNPQSLFNFWKPLLPAEEYQRQMQALCELVTARTGLQLCNLSQPAGEA